MIRRPLVAAAAAVAALAVAPLPAQSAEDYFKGKTINVYSGGSAGGGFTLVARVLTNTMKKHIPGNPDFVIHGMPGAGGARSLAFLANAAPQDGTALAAVLPPAVTAQLLRKVKYDAGEFHWLGSVTPMAEVSSVWHTAPATSLEEAKTVSLVMGTSSKVSSAYLIPAFLNAVVGTKFTFVQGYRGGGPMNIAMEKGEIHGRGSFYNSYKTTKPDWLRDRKIIHLVQVGPPIADLPDVPKLRDLIKTDTHRQIVDFMEVGARVGHGFAAPPGVPAERVAVLRKAFEATVRDPEFLAEAAKRKIVVDPVPGPELQAAVEKAARTPAAVVAEFKKLVQLK